MAKRKSYLLRIPPDLWEDISQWAADELRSVNGHMEWVLREAVRQRKRRNPGAKPKGGAKQERGAEPERDP